jgi:2-keto-4-pentenoate hydratase/2-oxohepta-3-ene-1,7-dioic acid hydratase in catechol pathway
VSSAGDQAGEEFVRFLRQGLPAWGRLEGGRLSLLKAAPWLDGRPGGETVDAAGMERLCPTEPGKIVCVGINYRDHALEMGHTLPAEPLIFLKPASSLLEAGKPIRRPPGAGRVDYEAELALVIGKKTGPGDDAKDAIFGVTCANDVTARDLQKKDGQWTRGKGFDSFCPLGPSLVRGLDLSDLAVECRVNGVLKQSSRTSQLVFPPEQLVRFVAGIMTLNPGDLILTGTPGGIGPLVSGDSVEVRIQHVGALTNPVL